MSYNAMSSLLIARVILLREVNGTVFRRGRLYIYVRSEYHTQLAKMSFDEIFDLTAGVYYNFYNIYG